MLLKIIRFCRGYVDFRAVGKFPERFLNLTSRYGVNIWNANPTDNGLEASMSVYDYRKIRNLTRKLKIKTKIKSKHGMPFIINKYKPRVGLAVGAVIGAVLLIILSNIVWSISITGTNRVSNTYLLDVLKKNGVSVGVYKNNLDVKSIERNVLLQIDDIGWMSVNIVGNTVSVEVKEKYEKPELNSDTGPCNIKAASDGVITDIKASKGVTQVLIGSGVTKGDLLVSGIMETKVNTIQYVHASAEVYADVIYQKELKTPIDYQYYSLTKNKTNRNRLLFLWFDFPCSFSFKTYKDFAADLHSQNLWCNNITLPLGIKTQTSHEVLKKNTTQNDKTAKQVLTNSALLYEVFEKPNSTLVSRKMNISKTKDSYICKTDYIFNENIAQTVDFDVTE